MAKETIIKFEKPYIFEGTTYTEIDLKKIDELTAKDMITAEKIFTAGGNASAVTEMSMAYVCILASIVTKLPQEFFEGLPAKEALKVKAEVTSFLFKRD